MQHEIPKDGGGPAYARAAEEYCAEQDGMTLQQRAAIDLRVPRSGLPWLDDMIRESVRMDMIARVLPFAAEMFYRHVEVNDGDEVILAWDDNGIDGGIIGRDACALADAVLIESETEPVDKETRDKWREELHRDREKEREAQRADERTQVP